jgi:hypothetical protein
MDVCGPNMLHVHRDHDILLRLAASEFVRVHSLATDALRARRRARTPYQKGMPDMLL